MTRFRSIIAGAVIALGAAAIVTIAAPADAGPDGLRLTAHQALGLSVIPCHSCVLNRYGFATGAHIGEFLINEGTLTDSGGKSVGHYAIHILGTTVATSQPPEVQLTGTLSLPNGQITFQGLEEPPTTAGTIAITGGTGRYQNATGELRFRDLTDTTTTITVELH